MLKKKHCFEKKAYRKNSFFLKNGSRFWVPIWFRKTGDNEVQPNRLLHLVVPRLGEPKTYPFFGTNIFALGTVFSSSELLARPARGQQNNLKQLAWIGLDWLGLAWIRLDWLGLAWAGLDWLGLAWVGLDGLEWVWISLDWLGLAWIGLDWLGLARTGLDKLGFAWIGLD